MWTPRSQRKALWGTAWVIALLVVAGIVSAQGRREDTFERARDAHQRHTERLCAINEVQATGVGLDEQDGPVIRVFLDRPGARGIPKDIEGVAVQSIVTGRFYALASRPAQVRRPASNPYYYARPVPIGVSTGNEEDDSAGTIACRVTDGKQVYVLSNNHVYALENTADVPSDILQPGLYDTNGQYDPANVIGSLYAFAPLTFSQTASNQIDAAIALTSIGMLGKATPSGGYGTPQSKTLAAAVRQPVMKYGRTTKLTMGQVYAVNATVKVTYASGVTRFVNQILITPGWFSAAGDSGSLIVYAGAGANYGKPIGLLFAGSQTVTVANPIDPVLAHFGVRIDGQ